MTLFKKKHSSKIIIASLQNQQCRVYLFDRKISPIKLILTEQFLYTDHSTLAEQFLNTVKSFSARNTQCRWVLGSDLYESHIIDKPNTEASELHEAVKWLLKDLVEQPINELLTSFYQPNHPDKQNNQLVAIAVNKAFTELLIEVSKKSGLLLDSIEIEELSLGNAFKPQLEEHQYVGFVGENSEGLIFNFYNNGKLCFSRTKKGQFIPLPAQEGEFVLDSEDKEELFWLETQRSLDYVVSQVFRRPLDKILLQKNNTSDKLISSMQQITDIPVEWVSADVTLSSKAKRQANLAEIGAASRQES